ncbi:MAG: 50S ribosomal protein L10 [Bacteroidia bacterium]
MTKEEKFQLVAELTEQFRAYPNFYITDTSGMSVSKVNQLRRKCFENNIRLTVIKNTLIRKALENLDSDYSEVFDALKVPSSVLFATSENPSLPAKIIKEFRRENEKPILKAACIDTAVFKGDNQLDTLLHLKSKDELVGEIIGLLQSPARNVIGALQSGGQKLAGILQTLSEKESA